MARLTRRYTYGYTACPQTWHRHLGDVYCAGRDARATSVGWRRAQLCDLSRPALVVSGAFGDQDCALITVVTHTTSLRGSAFEVAVSVSFLKPGVFLVQGVTTFPTLRALHRL